MIVIDGYTIDAALRETHTREAELTDYPVESGATVTDHRRRLPKMVEVEGIVSDTPIGTMATLRGGATGSASPDGELLFLPSDEALAKLEALDESGEPVTIETGLKTYENMELVHLEIPVDITTGEALRFTASFREILLVKVNRTTVRVSSPSGAGKAGRGSHAAPVRTVNPVDEARKSILTDGPNKDGYFVGPDGRPLTGVKWDPKKGAYVDEDGMPLITQVENSTYYDAAEGEFVNSDGSPVTRDQMNDALTHGGKDPWWKGGT